MKDRKIYCLNNIAKVGTDVFRKGYTLIDSMDEAAGVLVRSADMKDMQFPAGLRAIARAGAGVNNIPVDRCTEAGIVVFNSPGANSNAVKELGICALLLASRDIIGGSRWVWDQYAAGEDVAAVVEKGKSAFTGPELTGKSLGVIGLGAVGARVANAAVKLDMDVYGYDPYLSVDAAWGLSSQIKHVAEMDTIFRSCDYISIHVPYMPSTHHTINAEAIEKMKDGVRILNLARAELVDDDAMLAALESGKVARYVTDFPNAKTAKGKNIVAFPHLAASTPEAEEKCAVMGAKEIRDYLENGNITNSVNLPNASLDRVGESRLCILHKNQPKMLNQFLEVIAQYNINVAHMVNKARGEYAYTIFDTDTKLTDDILRSVTAVEGVIRTRLI